MKKLIFAFLSLFLFTTITANPLDLTDAAYKIMMERSLTSCGNNYRIKKVIEKLRKGEAVYVAALGGSVTEGKGPASFREGYAYHFNRKLADEFAAKREKVYFVNAGLSGTQSPLGLIRYEQDVIAPLGNNPDLLIIEYAVNDIEEPTKQRAFEALIHDALSRNENTAIIILYSAAVYPKTQKVMMPIAEYYGLQQVSPSDAYDYAVLKGFFKSSDYLTDVVHPTAAGHEIMADCLINMMKTVDKAVLDSKPALPEKALKSPDFFNFKRITESNDEVKIISGGFDRSDPNTQTVDKNGKANFPQNWYHSSKSLPDSLVFNVTCKNFILVYKIQGSWLSEKFGKAEIYVDGKKFSYKSATLFDGGKPNGWNNCENLLIIDDAEAKPHKIEVRMAKGNEKKGFTVVCAGYSK